MEILWQTWRNENLKRKYPFSDSATMLTNSGIEIAIDLFIDAKFWYYKLQAPICLTDIVVTDYNTVQLIIRDINDVTLTANIDSSSTDRIIFYDSIDKQPAGMLLLSEPISVFYLLSLPVGDNTIDFGNMEFVLHTWYVTASDGIRGFLLPDNNLVGGSTINFVGGLGVYIQPIATKDQLNYDICLNVVGEPLMPYVNFDACSTKPPDYLVSASTKTGASVPIKNVWVNDVLLHNLKDLTFRFNPPTAGNITPTPDGSGLVFSLNTDTSNE